MYTLQELRERERSEYNRIMHNDSIPMMERIKKFKSIKNTLDSLYNETEKEIKKLQEVVDNKSISFQTRKLAMNTIYELSGMEECKF